METNNNLHFRSVNVSSKFNRLILMILWSFLVGNFNINNAIAIEDPPNLIALNDPTKPKKFISNGDESELNGSNILTLNLIMVTENKKIAIINNVQLQEEDRIMDLKVIAIKTNKVLLQPIVGSDQPSIENKLTELANNNPFFSKKIKNNFIELTMPNESGNKNLFQIKYLTNLDD